MSNITQMACPSCGYAYSKTINANRSRQGNIRRQRKCAKCGAGFVTYEIAAADHQILASLRKWRENDNREFSSPPQNGVA